MVFRENRGIRPPCCEKKHSARRADEPEPDGDPVDRRSFIQVRAGVHQHCAVLPGGRNLSWPGRKGPGLSAGKAFMWFFPRRAFSEGVRQAFYMAGQLNACSWLNTLKSRRSRPGGIDALLSRGRARRGARIADCLQRMSCRRFAFHLFQS